MTREQAINLLHKHMQNVNLRRHCYAVEVAMLTIYDRLVVGKPDETVRESWGIAGLLHDADYEITKDSAKKDHTKHIINWLEELDAKVDVRDAIARHAWGYVEGAPEPKSKMDWALYTCDELTGLIVACALVKPDKKLSSVTADSVMKKWRSSSFAAGVNRRQIEQCVPRLKIPLQEFIQITLTAMQSIHIELGL